MQTSISLHFYHSTFLSVYISINLHFYQSIFLQKMLYQFSQTRLYLFILSTHCSQPPKSSPFLRCRSGLYNITIYNYWLFSPYQTLQTSIAPSLSPVSSFPLILLLCLLLYLLYEYSFLSSSFCSTASRSLVVSTSDVRSFPPFSFVPEPVFSC
jgi:hypothetical protein